MGPRKRTRLPAIRCLRPISIIHQANYLLDQQLKRLEHDFLKEGCLRERMTRAAIRHLRPLRPMLAANHPAVGRHLLPIP